MSSRKAQASCTLILERSHTVEQLPGISGISTAAWSTAQRACYIGDEVTAASLPY